MQQIANILEQLYSLVLFIPVGAATVAACTRKKIN
jgi:hypothetical protein